MLTTAARTSGHVPDAAARQVEGDLGTDDIALLICRTLWEERTREAALRGGEPQGRGGGSRPATRTTPCLGNPAARFRAYYSVPVKPHSGLTGPPPAESAVSWGHQDKIKERGETCLYPPSWLPGVARPPTKSRAGRRDLATSRVTKATSRIRSEHAQTLGSMLCTTLSWPVPRGRSNERIRAPHRAVNDPSRGMLCVCV